MSEADSVGAADAPRTRDSLAEDLGKLGLRPGMTVLVHSSLKSLGYVSGGPVPVVQALMDVLTPAGTLVMPAHSGDYSDPSEWRNPPVPSGWWQIIRDTMPAFDPRVTPTRGMGRIAETFRTFPGVLRSPHPCVSFAAWGRHAELVCGNHSLDYSLGERSPLARIYDLDGVVLLLGARYDTNTSFHLAEYRVPDPPTTTQGAPVMEEGRRVWKTYTDVDFDSDDFDRIGADLERSGHVTVSRVGSAEARLFSQRLAVDFATEWLPRCRTRTPV